MRNAAAAASGDGIHDDSRELISVVLHDTETVWTKLFDEQIQETSYRAPKLVMFDGTTQTACGTG